jgi:pyruvate/2-oxoglutarate dehydrogenase complex dihydrolipoamide acyltransferase (E2) component
MINIIKAPRINTNDDKVGLIVWHVSNGDYIEAGQAVGRF